MVEDSLRQRLTRWHTQLLQLARRGAVPAGPLTIILACIVGVLGGFGAVFFNWLIHTVNALSVQPFLEGDAARGLWRAGLCVVPALGLIAVSWFTRRFAPEAQGHGVPEVITAVARHDGIIRSRVSVVKVLASGFCIGTGGSVGREGPIVQIGSSLGSVAGQLFKLSARNMKVLVASGAAAGISATFNAPLAGVIFSSEIILGNFAVQSLTPIVISSVLAAVVQKHVGEHGQESAFTQLSYAYLGALEQLPLYFLLGLLCGLAAVAFTKGLYVIEDQLQRWISRWWMRAVVAGLIVGAAGLVYPRVPPSRSVAALAAESSNARPLPPVFGVGYTVVDHALHLESSSIVPVPSGPVAQPRDKMVKLERAQMMKELWWLLPLVFLKPVLTSVTLAGGGSGGIFAPSLFLGSTLGACFGLVVNLVFPEHGVHPGVYAVVGMGAVVAGTTHGPLSAILIVYEMTNDYRIILPIMTAAVISSVVAARIDPESIYHKKLSRRGELVARVQDVSALEDIKVRDLMIRKFPSAGRGDTLTDIVKIAHANPDFESLPVMDEKGQLLGIIRPEDMRRVLDSEMPPHLLRADDIALHSRIAVSPDENLLEALRDFGTRDIDTLPVEAGSGDRRRLVGLLRRADVMRRYRQVLLRSLGDARGERPR